MIIKRFDQLNESEDRMAQLKAHREYLRKEIEDVDREIEELITATGGDPIKRLNAWLDRASHKNRRSFLPSGKIRKWLDDYVWGNDFGDPDMWPRHSTHSLAELLQEYGIDHDNHGDFQLGVKGITEELIDYIIEQDYDEFKIDW